MQDFYKTLKEHNLTAMLQWGSLTLNLPSSELDGLDEEELTVSISSKMGQQIKIDLMPLPGQFTLKKWWANLLQSFKSGIEEQL